MYYAQNSLTVFAVTLYNVRSRERSAKQLCALKCRPIMKRRRILSSTIRQKTLQIKNFDEFLFSRFSVFFHANADLTTTYVNFSLKYKENSERRRRNCLLFYCKNKLVILLRLLLNRIRTKQFLLRNSYQKFIPILEPIML